MEKDKSVKDGLYEKYRVFKEPDEAPEHPVDVHAVWMKSKVEPNVLEEVKSFVFVLKPDTDPHARVALAAYAASVRADKPQLAEDLWSVFFDE